MKLKKAYLKLKRRKLELIQLKKLLFYKKYRITGSKMTPIAWDFLTFIKEESIPIGVEIKKIKKPKSPVKR